MQLPKRVEDAVKIYQEPHLDPPKSLSTRFILWSMSRFLKSLLWAGRLANRVFMSRASLLDEIKQNAYEQDLTLAEYMEPLVKAHAALKTLNKAIEEEMIARATEGQVKQ